MRRESLGNLRGIAIEGSLREWRIRLALRVRRLSICGHAASISSEVPIDPRHPTPLIVLAGESKENFRSSCEGSKGASKIPSFHEGDCQFAKDPGTLKACFRR